VFKEIYLDIDYNNIVNYVLKIADERMPDKNNKAHQVAVQCREGITDSQKQLYESTKSFNYDWDAFDPDTMKVPPIKPIDQWLKQEDFFITPDVFKNTPIEKLNNYLVQTYNVCRGRIMNMSNRSALSWHYDDSPRLHIPIKINKGSFMVLEDNVCKFEVGKAYLIDTTKMHTAVNADFEYRIHLVYCVKDCIIRTEPPQ
jgi:hypothetical protein